MVIVPFQAFADRSRGGIVERHVQCAQSPMHVVGGYFLLARPVYSSEKHTETQSTNKPIIQNTLTIVHL